MSDRIPAFILYDPLDPSKVIGLEEGQTGDSIPVGYGGTGATDAATARTNLGLTPADIKTDYESNADTNAFTNDDETKLDGLDISNLLPGASDAQIAADETGPGFTLRTLLAGTNVSITQDANHITVSVPSSGLDADTLDGAEGSHYLNMSSMVESAADKILTAAERAEIIVNTAHSATAHAPSGAEANPATVTAGEITAGTEPSDRLWSPEDVKAAILAHETGGGAPVDSVNGKVGVVTLDSDEIPEGAVNLYYSDGRVATYIATVDIDTLADVSSIAPINGYVMTWDSGLGKWKPSALPSTTINLTGNPGTEDVIVENSGGTNATIPAATATEAGTMTAADKVILDQAILADGTRALAATLDADDNIISNVGVATISATAPTEVLGKVWVDTTGSSGSISYAKHRKDLILEWPTASEDLGVTFFSDAVTIVAIEAVLKGSSTPSVTWTLRHSPDRSLAGTEVITGGTVTTDITSGDTIIVFNDATIPANSFVWFETTAQSGTVNSIQLTIDSTED